jgi:hypothetical protein
MNAPRYSNVEKSYWSVARTIVVVALIGLAQSPTVANDAFNGRWKIDTERSSALDPWRSLEIELAINSQAIPLSEILNEVENWRFLKSSTL